jgi:hypothetical protein
LVTAYFAYRERQPGLISGPFRYAFRRGQWVKPVAWFADLLAIYAIAIGLAVSPAMGIFQYITKPCHPDNRLLIVRNACRLYQLQRENELLALAMKVTAPNLGSGCRGWGCATISRVTRSIRYCTRQGSRETGIGDPIDPVALCRG